MRELANIDFNVKLSRNTMVPPNPYLKSTIILSTIWAIGVLVFFHVDMILAHYQPVIMPYDSLEYWLFFESSFSIFLLAIWLIPPYCFWRYIKKLKPDTRFEIWNIF